MGFKEQLEDRIDQLKQGVLEGKVQIKLKHENNRLILNFIEDYCKANGFSPNRMLKYIRYLANVSDVLDKNFLEAEKEELIKVVREKYGNGSGRLQKASLEPRKCWHSGCEYMNKLTNRWCEKCGRVLVLKEKSVQETHEIIDKDVMSVLLKKPTVQQAIEQELRKDE